MDSVLREKMLEFRRNLRVSLSEIDNLGILIFGDKDDNSALQNEIANYRNQTNEFLEKLNSLIEFNCDECDSSKFGGYNKPNCEYCLMFETELKSDKNRTIPCDACRGKPFMMDTWDEE